MTQKDQLATLLAIINYALYGVEPTLKAKMPAAVFTVARPIIDVDTAQARTLKQDKTILFALLQGSRGKRFALLILSAPLSWNRAYSLT